MKEYKLSNELFNQWSYNGYGIKYLNNKTDDIEIKNINCSLYFDRLNEYSFFTLTTNATMNEEIVKLAYKTLSYLNTIKRENNDEQVNATTPTWNDNPKEADDKIEGDI